MCIDSARVKNFDNFMADPKNNTKTLLKTLKIFFKTRFFSCCNG